MLMQHTSSAADASGRAALPWRYRTDVLLGVFEAGQVGATLANRTLRPLPAAIAH
jgi:hypothetical protein